MTGSREKMSAQNTEFKQARFGEIDPDEIYEGSFSYPKASLSIMTVMFLP